MGNFCLDDSFIDIFTRNAPNLNHIGIGNIKGLTSKSIFSIAENCKNLIDLNAHQMGDKITFESFEYLFEKAKKLLVIDVSGSFGLSSSQIEKLNSQFSFLREDW